MRNVFRIDAWYVRAYNALPGFLRPLYCESCRVEYDTTSFCRFGLELRRSRNHFARKLPNRGAP